jgi:hypothetical protein
VQKLAAEIPNISQGKEGTYRDAIGNSINGEEILSCGVGTFW